ncbi:MAG: hypothetical protein GY930_14090 [bacterium]|nr:hypothetical protein [bacterium]
MTYRSPIVLAAVAVLTATSFAQTQRSALGVRIQSTFRAADANKNGTVSVLEAAKAGIPPVSFAKYDGNKDRRLSSDEFEKYYRALIAARKQDQAKRVAAKKASTRRRSFKPVTGTKLPAPVFAPKKNVAPDATGKPVGAKPVPVAADVPVAAPPVIPAPVEQDAQVKSVEKTPQPKQPTPDTVRKNRDILQAGAIGKRYVKDLQSRGRLGAKDAEDIVNVMTLPAAGLSAAESFREWRTALNNARNRIGVLVQSGALSAAEGREMYLIFEQRAKDAVAWMETGGVTEIKPQPAKHKTLNDAAAKGNVDGSAKPVNVKKVDKAVGKSVNKSTDDAAATKRAHDQQGAKDLRTKAAAKQVEDRATKDRELKDRQAKARAAKDAQTANKLPKDATSSTVPRAKTRKPDASKRKGLLKKSQAKKPAVKDTKKDFDAKKSVKQDS